MMTCSFNRLKPRVVRGRERGYDAPLVGGRRFSCVCKSACSSVSTRNSFNFRSSVLKFLRLFLLFRLGCCLM